MGKEEYKEGREVEEGENERDGKYGGVLGLVPPVMTPVGGY